MKKTLNKENITEFLMLKKIDNDINETLNNIFQWKDRFDVDIIYRFMILNVINEINTLNFAQIDIKMKNEKVDF